MMPDPVLGYSMVQASAMTQSQVRAEAEAVVEMEAMQDKQDHLQEQALVTQESEAIVALQEEDDQ